MLGSCIFIKGEAETHGKRTFLRPFRGSVVLAGFESGPPGSKAPILCISQHRPGGAAITNTPQVSEANEGQQHLCSPCHSIHLSHLADRAAATMDFANCWAEGKRALKVPWFVCFESAVSTQLVGGTSLMPRFQQQEVHLLLPGRKHLVNLFYSLLIACVREPQPGPFRMPTCPFSILILS